LNAATLNEALAQLDAVIALYLKGQFVNTPPASPADGDAYLLGASPTGAWSGYAYKIAHCLDGGWRFFTPFDGLTAFVTGTGQQLIYQGGTWTALGALMAGADASIASAATCDLGAAGALCVLVTGTATITSFGSAANRLVLARFAGALTLMHHGVSLSLLGGASRMTAANDVGLYRSDAGGNWREIFYARAAADAGDAATKSGAETLTNKTLDAASNAVSNLAVSMFAANAADTDGTLAANSDTRFATQKAVKTYADQIAAVRPGRNLLIDGDFRVNQRGYTSGGILSAGAFGHDRWKAGASGGDYSFTQLPSATQITIASGKTLIQIVEDKNVQGGGYVLSWEGTAQARVGISGAAPSGAYAASPLAITGAGAGQSISAEFNSGTLGRVQLEAGSIATPFEHVDYAAMLQRCQRYYQRFNFSSAQIAVGMAYSASDALFVFYFPEMRVAPTITQPPSGAGAGQAYWSTSTFQPPSGYGNHTADLISVKSARLRGGAYTGLTAGAPSGFFAGAGSQVTLDAEL
ncbi:MAG: hypothetical protein BGN82_06220, partial [Alphaproteobacteria bacterium 65-7]